MFGRNKEVLVTKWQPATWDGQTGYARNSAGKGKEDWDFSVKLPADVDPEHVQLGYSDLKFTVSYRVAETLFWRLMELSDYSKRDRHLINFSAYMTLQDLEKAVGPENINQSPPLLEL